MREASMVDCPTTQSREQSGRMTGISHNGFMLCDNSLKVRAVVVLVSAPWGTKGKAAEKLVREFERRRLKVSGGSLRRWQRRFFSFGLAGLSRRRRSDAGFPRSRFHKEECVGGAN
jgi:hypothetical protein